MMYNFLFSLWIILQSVKLMAHLLVVVLHDVRVLQLVKCVDLRDQLLLFPLLHPAVVQLFPAQNRAVCFPLDLEHGPEAA